MAEAQGANEPPEGTEGTSVEGQEPTKPAEGVAGHKRVLILFERCLIACALYEEFWTKVLTLLVVMQWAGIGVV